MSAIDITNSHDQGKGRAWLYSYSMKGTKWFNIRYEMPFEVFERRN
ncbi:MAG: hypothetical protein ACI84C_000899 [Flavobacteriales bacterium]|jgi:hypothetical protein